MSDLTIRELERRFRASGAVDDEARWLAARMRSSDVERLRVTIAAYCAHPAALVASVGSCPAPVGDIKAWSDGLSVLSRVACVVAACELARWILPRYEKDRPRGKVPRQAIEAAEAWTACPCETHVKAVKRAAGPAGRAVHEVDGGRAGYAAVMAAQAACAAARAVYERQPTRGGGELAQALDVTQAALKRGRQGREDCLERIRAAVVCWALTAPLPGISDPILALPRRAGRGKQKTR